MLQQNEETRQNGIGACLVCTGPGRDGIGTGFILKKRDRDRDPEQLFFRDRDGTGFILKKRDRDRDPEQLFFRDRDGTGS